MKGGRIHLLSIGTHPWRATVSAGFQHSDTDMPVLHIMENGRHLYSSFIHVCKNRVTEATVVHVTVMHLT